MNVVKDWEALVRDLRRREQKGDTACRLLLEKAEIALEEAKNKPSQWGGT